HPPPRTLTSPPLPRPAPRSLHDALPISSRPKRGVFWSHASSSPRISWIVIRGWQLGSVRSLEKLLVCWQRQPIRSILNRISRRTDRKSTRLNSSHVAISYAVFCLKKKKQ